MIDAATQRMEALALANRKRTVVAVFKQSLRDLPRQEAADRLAYMLEHPLPHALDGAVVYAVISSLRWFGHIKTSQILREAGVNAPDRRIRDLTPRQRALVAKRVKERAL